jgi:hypothetical protein
VTMCDDRRRRHPFASCDDIGEDTAHHWVTRRVFFANSIPPLRGSTRSHCAPYANIPV